MTAQVITRFGRTYTEYNPGGGPSTWILTAPGAGGGSEESDPSGTFTPADSETELKAGMALYMPEPGELDLALAVDGAPGQSVEPFRVIGLSSMDAVADQVVTVVTDRQVRRTDWTVVTGAVDLLAGRTYYLSSTVPGALQATAPQGEGVTVVSVGRATDERTLDVEINIHVRL